MLAYLVSFEDIKNLSVKELKGENREHTRTLVLVI
jgi:hypothetical protein